MPVVFVESSPGVSIALSLRESITVDLVGKRTQASTVRGACALQTDLSLTKAHHLNDLCNRLQLIEIQGQFQCGNDAYPGKSCEY